MSSEKEVMEYTDFLVEFEVARQTQDSNGLTHLLHNKVRCTFCETVVTAVDAVIKGGELRCPHCGEYWMARLKKKWWQFWK